METYHIIRYPAAPDHFSLSGFEEALHHSSLRYSMRDIIRAGITSQEEIMAALHRSVQICALAGIPVRHHFRRIYIFDSDSGATYSDWLMSRRGFKLMMMQFPAENEQIAQWHWEISG